MLDQPVGQRALQPAQGRQTPRRRLFVALLLVVLLMVALLGSYGLARTYAPQPGAPIELSYSAFVSDVNAGQVAAVTIRTDGNITGQFKRPLTSRQPNSVAITSTVFHTTDRQANDQALYALLEQHGVKIYQKQSSATDWWPTLLLTIAPLTVVFDAVMVLLGLVVLAALAVWLFGASRRIRLRPQW